MWEYDIVNITFKSKNELQDKLTAVHELIECILTEEEGIEEIDILTFDQLFELRNRIDEPGDDPNSPYREHHQFAELVEKLMLNFLKRDIHGRL